MNRTDALRVLGLPPATNAGQVKAAFAELHQDYQTRLMNAPTERLRATFRQRLEELEAARGTLEDPNVNLPATHPSEPDGEADAELAHRTRTPREEPVPAGGEAQSGDHQAPTVNAAISHAPRRRFQRAAFMGAAVVAGLALAAFLLTRRAGRDPGHNASSAANAAVLDSTALEPEVLPAVAPSDSALTAFGQRHGNPVPVDSASLATGQALFSRHCASCHGPSGLGDAPDAVPTSVRISGSQTAQRRDGYIYAIMRAGRGVMPPTTAVGHTQRWHVVNYVRLLQGSRTCSIATAERTIALDQSFTAVFGPSACIRRDGTRADVYRFAVTTRDSLTITMTGGSFVPRLAIQDWEGVTLASATADQGTRTARLKRRFGLGTYYLIANAGAVGASGTYTLSVRGAAGTGR